MFDNNNDPPQKVDIPEFAKRIRAKYPDAYNDIDDYELTERTIRKHPTYYNTVNVPQEFSLLGGATSGYPEIDKLYVEAATKYNVPADLLLEQGRKETGFSPDVFYGRRNSSAGAQGAGQFMPGTAPLYGVKDRKDPIQSIHGQAKYMRKLLDDFDGDEALALAGYNAGEHRKSLKAGKIPNIPETQDYVKVIQAKLAEARAAQVKRLRDFYPSTQQPQQPRLPGPGTAAPSPTFPGSPMAPPVASPALETPATIEKQAASAIDGNSPRAAVLLTDRNQVKLIDPNLISNLKPVETPNGLLLVNEAKAKALGVTDYGANMATLIGKVEDVGTATDKGKAVVTMDAEGNELASSIVSSPQAAAEQAHVDRLSFASAADQQIVDAQDVVEKRAADNAQIAPPVPQQQPVVDPDQPDMPAPEAITETPEESYSQYLAYAQAEGITPMSPEEFAIAAQAEGATPQAQATGYQTQAEVPPTQQRTPRQTQPGQQDQQAETVTLGTVSQPREVGEQNKDFTRTAGEYTPNNATNAEEASRQAMIAVGGRYGITPGQVDKYIALRKQDGTPPITGEFDPNRTIRVPFSVLAEIAGEDEIAAQMQTEQVQGREAIQEPPGPVGRDWIKEDAEWLNSNAGNVLMALNPGFAFLEKEQRDELGATLAGGVIGSGARTARALAGIARPISTNIYEYMQSIAEPGEALEAKTGSDSIVSTVGRIVGGAPGDLSRLILLTRLPGGVIVGMGADMGLQSAGRGDDPKEILKQTVKGGSLGAVFAAAPIIGRLTGEFPVASLTASPMKQAIGREVATVGAVGLGSGLVEQTFGSTEEQALQTAIVNSLFHLAIRGVKLPGRTVRAKDAQGNEVNVGVDLNGAVRLLKGRVKKPDAEVFVDTKVGADGVYRAPGDTSPVRPKAVMDRLRAGTPPKELAERNPVRIDAPDPQAVQKAQIDTRVGKIADALAAKGPMTLEQLQKATRFNKNNTLAAIDTLYQARKIEILPDNSIRLIDKVGTKADQELYERYSQPRQEPPAEAGISTAPVPKPPAPVSPAGSGVQVGGTQAPVAPKPETPIDWREPSFQGTQKPEYQEATTTAQKAREEGRVTIDGTEYVRQQPMVETTPKGKAGKLRFADKEPDVPFEFRLVEAGTLQPAHMQGVPNRQHFIPEAQPNKRTDQASKLASDAIAARPDLEQVAESPIAYAGAPVVNTRGEAIQGNNRSEGLKKHYQGGGTLYKQSLAENAERFGFTRDDVEKMQNPVLVRMVDVDDDTAITLGNYRMADLESGGSQNIDPVRLAGRIPYQKKREILDDVFLNAPEDATLTDLIRGNEGLVRTLLDPYLTEGQKQTLVNAEKNLTPNAVKDIEASFRQFLFDKGHTNLPDLFEGLNYNAREAITASIPRVFSTPEESSIIPDLQNAIVASSQFQQSGVDSWDAWIRNPDMIANTPAPIEFYTPLELAMADAFNKAKTQKQVKDLFTEYAKIVNGSEGNMFEPATEPRSRAEAVREIFGVEDVKPRTTTGRSTEQAEERPQDDGVRGGTVTTEETRDAGRETVAPADRRGRESQEHEAREVEASDWTPTRRTDGFDRYAVTRDGFEYEVVDNFSKGRVSVGKLDLETRRFVDERRFDTLDEAKTWVEADAKAPAETAVAQNEPSNEVAKKATSAPTVPLPAYYRSIVRRELGRGQTPEEIAAAYKLDPGTIAGMREISDQNVGEYGQTSHYIRRMLMREENAPLINKLARVIVPQARIHENNPLFDKMSSLDAILDTIADTNGFLRSSEMDAKAWNDAMMSFADRVPFQAVNVIHEALAHQEEWFRKREALVDEFRQSDVMDDIISKSEQMGRPIVTTFKDTPDVRGKMRATSLRQRILDIGKKYAIEKTSDPQIKHTGLSRKSIEDAFNRALQRAFSTRTAFRVDNAGDRTTKPRDGEKGTGTSQEEIPFVRLAPQAEIDAVEEVRDKQGRLLAPNGKVSNLNELQWKQVRTPSFINWFGDWMTDPANASKVVDENGEPKVLMSGHANIERYDRYDPKASVAGGFYATENPEISSNYALGKRSPSVDFDDDNPGMQYRFRTKGKKFSTRIYDIKLTPEQQKIARDFFKDESMGYDVEEYWRENAPYDRHARQAVMRGGLANLQSIYRFMENMGENIWYTDHNDPRPYFEQQQLSRFEELMDKLGLEWQSLDREQPGNIPLFMNIRNPITPDKPFPADLLKALKKKAARVRDRESDVTQYWQKDLPMKEWVADIESGNEYWSTAIPAKAVATIKEFGYDGIRELGMKGAENPDDRQANWIALDAPQIKSATGNRGTFDPNDPNILFTQLSMFAQTDLFGNPIEVAPEQPSMFDMARSQVDAENQLRHELETAYGKRTADYIAGMETSANKQVARVARELADARLLVASKGTNALGIINDAADALDQFAIAQHTKSPIDVILAQGRLDTAVLSDQARDFARAMDAGKFAPMFRTALSKVRTDNEAIPMMVASIGTGDSTNAPFYSQLERTIEQKMPNKASADQVRGIIKETKAEEREWLGIDEFLGNRTVTKQEVLDFIAENQVRLEEVVKGGTEPKSQLVNIYEADGTWYVENDRTGKTYGEGSTRNEAIAEAEEHPDYPRDTSGSIRVPTKFSQYTLPGGENYRELLLTMPPRTKPVITDKGDHWEVVTGSETRKLAKADHPDRDFVERAAGRHVKETGEYRSNHWSEPNVLAHIRFDDRIIDGKRVMHVAEIQSDWHQEGRKKGYHGQNDDELGTLEARNIDPESGGRGFAIYTTGGEFVTNVVEPDGGLTEARALDIARRRLAGQRTGTVAPRFAHTVPDAPFKKSWAELSFKRSLRYAVENGYDALTWDTGETNAERYDLSKQVDFIDVGRGPENTLDIAILPLGETEDIRFYVDKATGKVVKQRRGGDFVGKNLDDVLGKELAEKILDPTRSYFSDVRFKGDDLKVGGEGMRGFYDKILPSFANKYTKKWGGKVQSADAPVELISIADYGNRAFQVFDQNRNALGPEHRTRAEAENWIADYSKPPVPVHSLTITPAMRDSVMQGQPLFNNSPARLFQKALADAEGNDVRKAFRNFRNLGMPSLAQNAKPTIDDATGTFIADIPTTIIFNEAVKRGTGQSVSFLGMYLHPTNVQRVRHGLMDIRREIFRSGNVPAAAAMDRVIGKFDESVDEDYGDVVFAFQDKRFPMTSEYSTQEELGHRGDERLKREVGNRIEDATPFIGADGYETAKKTLSDRYPERMLHREVLGKLQRDDAARELGITEEQAENLQAIRDDQLAGLNVTGQDYVDAYANISKANERRIKDYVNRATEEVSPRERPQRSQPEAGDDDGPLLRDGREVRPRGDTASQAVATKERDRRPLGRLRQAELRTASRSGTQETALTRAEERYIDIKTRKNPAIGETVKNEILFAKQVNNDSWGVKGIVLDVVSMPKSFKASLDTALGRQGWLLSLKHPVIGARAFRKQFPVIHPTRGLENYEKFKRDLNLHPFIELAEETGLFLASIADESNITEREESFMSRLLADDPYFKNMKAEKIRNLVTTHVRLSERVFKVLLDDIRINVFSKLAQQMHRWNVKNGRGDDIEQYKAIARFINYASGRGDLGSFNSAAPYFNGVFFSARWMMSRLQVMNPFFYAAMPPGARGLLFRELAGAIGAIGAIALLLKWAGADVEYDNPDDPNMLRIGFGNYKYQIDAGLMKHLRYAYRMTTATQESDSTRRMTYLTERYIRGSLAPVPGGIWSSLEGKNFIGEPTSYREEALEMFAPITIDSFREAIELDGTAGAVMMTPEILAIGTSRYRTADEVRAEMQKEQAKMKGAKTPAERKEVQRRVKAWNTLLKRAVKYDAQDRKKAAQNQ